VSSPRERIAWIRNEDCRFSVSLLLSPPSIARRRSPIALVEIRKSKVSGESEQEEITTRGLVRLAFLFHFSLNFCFCLSLSRDQSITRKHYPQAWNWIIKIPRRATNIEIRDNRDPEDRRRNPSLALLFILKWSDLLSVTRAYERMNSDDRVASTCPRNQVSVTRKARHFMVVTCVVAICAYMRLIVMLATDERTRCVHSDFLTVFA